jgi:hypothetical protein
MLPGNQPALLGKRPRSPRSTHSSWWEGVDWVLHMLQCTWEAEGREWARARETGVQHGRLDASPPSGRPCRCPSFRVPRLPAHVSPATPAFKHVWPARRQWGLPPPSRAWHRGERAERRGERCNSRSSFQTSRCNNGNIWLKTSETFKTCRKRKP